MSDLIDREALLRQIDIDSEGEPGYYGDTWKFIDTIKSMPPAELSTNLAEVGTDLISRQAAIDLLKQMRKDGDMIPWEGKDVFARIRKLPPAQPEIVRCEECKYHYQRNCPIEKYFSLDGFCSRGKRREVTT